MSISKTIRYILRHPLCQGRAGSSLARFARWQLASRLLPGPAVYPWINGARLVIARGDQGLTGNLYTGLHECAEMGFVLHALRPEDLFVDVGANLGSFTVLACAAVGARGYAFEPAPSNFRKLADNIAINHIQSRVHALQRCVGSSPGSVEFTDDQSSTNHALPPGQTAPGSVSVQVVTLDDALQHEQPFLIKVDVEGYEPPVIEGALKTLERPSLQAVVIELMGLGSRYGFDEAKAAKTLLDLGFHPCAYDPLKRSLAKITNAAKSADNTIFVRNLELVRERIRTAPVFDIFGVKV